MSDATTPSTCHLCSAPIVPGEHYVVRVDVFADPAMPEMSSAQLSSINLDEAMNALIAQMQHQSADELQDDVHRRFEYRICRSCQRRVLANPLGLPRGRKTGVN